MVVMVEVFYWILNMSILGSILGMVLLFLRRIKKIPRLLIYLLWGLVFIRLLCPVGLMSGLSLLNLLPRGSSRMVPASEILSDEQVRLSLLNFLQNATEYQPMVLESSRVEKFYQIASFLWMTGGMLALVSNLVMYYLSGREFRNLRLIRDDIYECEQVSMPMVYGLFQPKIILPAKVMSEDNNVGYLIAHETTHRKRHDNLWRFLAIMVACVHWFNPLIWLYVKKFFEDMELACDEATIRKMEEGERKQYAYTILSYAKKDTNLYAASFSGSKVKARIEHVVTYRNLTFVSILGFSLMFLILGILLLSNQ